MLGSRIALRRQGGRVCKFFAQGNCKKGNACTFLHTTNGGGFNSGGFGAGGFDNSAGFGNNNNSGFGGFGGNNNNGGGGNNNNGKQRWNKQTLKKQIQTDFTVTKSVWPFSSYGGPDEPSLMPGDFSFEEVRLEAYVEAAQGRFQQQIAKEQQMGSKMAQQKQALLKNPFHFVQGQNQQQGSPGGWGGNPNQGGPPGGGGNNNNMGSAWGNNTAGNSSGGGNSFTW